MTTRIDFYVLENTANQDQAFFACRLMAKIIRQDLKIIVQTSDSAHTQKIDQLLWTYQDDSFLAHDIYPDVIDSIAPIQITHQTNIDIQSDVLLNLTEQIPIAYPQFPRVIEIINQHEAIKQAGRARYRQYQQNGHTPENMHRIHQ
jgi:DNA polymerase-3 subunit chi